MAAAASVYIKMLPFFHWAYILLDRIGRIDHNTIGVMTFLPIRLFAVAFLAAHLETGRLMHVEQCVYVL